MVQVAMVLSNAQNSYQCNILHLHQWTIHQPLMTPSLQIPTQKSLLWMMIILTCLKKKMMSTSYLLEEGIMKAVMIK
uniref:Uncharacterized protein n=1 Tax=Arundo donax TaxID=35708 RepID=A0A0A9CA30_ARUDO